MPPLPVSPSAATMHGLAVDLPPAVYEGIGKVVAAHAILEKCVHELLYDLMVVHYSVARISIEHRDPAKLFGTARELMDHWGIKIEGINLKKLEDDIRSHTKKRNAVAHGLWMHLPHGSLALRLILGHYEAPDGETRNRATLPEPFVPPPGYFDINEMLDTAETLMKIKAAIRGAMPDLPPFPDRLK